MYLSGGPDPVWQRWAEASESAAACPPAGERDREGEELGVTLAWLSCPLCLPARLQRRWNKQEENFPPASAVCDENTDGIGLKWLLSPSEVEEDAAEASFIQQQL